MVHFEVDNGFYLCVGVEFCHASKPKCKFPSQTQNSSQVVFCFLWYEHSMCDFLVVKSNPRVLALSAHWKNAECFFANRLFLLLPFSALFRPFLVLALSGLKIGLLESRRGGPSHNGQHEALHVELACGLEYKSKYP